MNDRLRIGDAEREAAVRELGEHFALGRIDAEEHTERLEQILGARTSADLAPAFRDLPRPAATPQKARPTTRGRRPQLPRIPLPLKLLLVIVLVWWGFHHLLLLLLALIGYVLFVRRFTHRRRWYGRHDRGPYQAGWH